MLLKDEWMCASPEASTCTFFFFLTDLAIVVDFGGDRSLETHKLRPEPKDYFFLFATVLRRPFRVRELFLVRCPRRGKPLRWRMPRWQPMSMSRLMS